MNTLRKYSGIIWMLLSPAAIVFIVYNFIHVLGNADKKIIAATTDAARTAAEAAKTNSILQWSIIIIIFIPIAFGLLLFGRYSWKGEYDR